MTRTTAAHVKTGDTLHRVDNVNMKSWVHDRPYDARVLSVGREVHGGVTYAVFTLEPTAPATSSLVRTPLTRGVDVTTAP